MDSIKRKSFNANVDLIHGPIFKSLIIFALPLFISNIFQQLYNTVDTMIVGNFLGDASLAAIGSCTSIYDLLVGFALGIGNGLAIVTARSFGSKDEKLLKKSVASSLVIGIVVSIGLTLIGLIFLQPLLHLLNTPANIIDEAYSYIFFIVLFIIVMFAYNLYTETTPGWTLDDAWKQTYYAQFTDTRAVDETLELMREDEHRILDYQSMIPDTDYGDFTYSVYALAKKPSEQLEEMTPTWNGKIDKANAD